VWQLLTKQRTVYSFMWLVDDKATFTDGEEESPRFFEMNGADWDDMGKPETITVTVEPGDLLNS
jgi:hypothetical protein